MDKAAQILRTFGKVLPELTDSQLDYLLAYGEGMAFKACQKKAGQASSPPPATERPGA